MNGIEYKWKINENGKDLFVSGCPVWLRVDHHSLASASILRIDL